MSETGSYSFTGKGLLSYTTKLTRRYGNHSKWLFSVEQLFQLSLTLPERIRNKGSHPLHLKRSNWKLFSNSGASYLENQGKYCVPQCSRSGSVGSVLDLLDAQRIRIRNLFVGIQLRVQILPSTSKKIEEKP